VNGFDYGPLTLNQLTSYSFPDPSIFEVRFHNAAYSDISLIDPTCIDDDSCYDPTFGSGDIFFTDGTY
jgi:hypothetical protein